MSTYKVIQDIEAEDKLLGPLSFRQFIYFLAGSFLAFLNFTAATKGGAFVLLVLGPPMLFCFFFAFPWTPDQPTEVWALARIRYYFKPRKRLWNQSGVKEFVTVTAPVRIDKAYTDGLSQTEVHSRLEALASTIDTRGWAIKNDQTQRFKPQISDRLIAYEVVPTQVAEFGVHDADDILDEQNNVTAQQMGQLLNTSTQNHHQLLMDRMNDSQAAMPAPTQTDWFQRQQVNNQPVTVAPVSDSMTALPAVPSQAVAQQPAPIVTTPAPVAPAAPAQATMPIPEPTKVATDAAILNLAHDNNMDVATLAREAQRAKGGDLSDDEVVVSLH